MYEKKSTELIASHVCENILYEKSHSFNGKKKMFLKYRALFYHDKLFQTGNNLAKSAKKAIVETQGHLHARETRVTDGNAYDLASVEGKESV